MLVCLVWLLLGTVVGLFWWCVNNNDFNSQNVYVMEYNSCYENYKLPHPALKTLDTIGFFCLGFMNLGFKDGPNSMVLLKYFGFGSGVSLGFMSS